MFKLSENFISQYRGKQPNWGFGDLSYFVYKRTYSRAKQDGSSEEFWETCQRVVEGVFNIQLKHCNQMGLSWSGNKAQISAQKMFQKMWEMKFLPPGRGLWLMGTPIVDKIGSGGLNNPLCENTKILTKEHGWVALKDIEGKEVTVLSNTKLYGRDNDNPTCPNPVWAKASISHGEMHPCLEIEYKDREGNTFSVTSSENHRWFRRKTSKHPWERVEAVELQRGDYMPKTKPMALNFNLCPVGIQHGYFFGDGTKSNGELHQFGDEDITILRSLFTNVDDASPVNDGTTHAVARHLPLAWGSVPGQEYETDRRYMLGFLAGYVAADGNVSNSAVRIHSANKENLRQVKRIAKNLGIASSDIKLVSTSSNYKEERELFEVKLNRYDLNEEFFVKPSHRVKYLEMRSKWLYDKLRITNIRKLDGLRRVLCATVPKYEQFVTEGWVLTSNCGFISTKDIYKDFSMPFKWAADMLMLGVGIGFDTKGAGSIVVHKPDDKVNPLEFVIPDTREGWVEAVGVLLDSYAKPDQRRIKFSFDEIRLAGAPIKGFGGIASGPEPLKEGLAAIASLLDALDGEKITSVAITDIFNYIGKFVVSGNVRRSAEIAIGEGDDQDFLEMKDPELHADELMDRRWASNNSVFVTPDSDFGEIVKRISKNGEPGLIFLDNARHYGRLRDGWHPVTSSKYDEADGFNPCGEQSLRHAELCCVSRDTRILTRDGYPTIESVVGQEVEVWNGKNWSKVTPFLAGKDKTLYRVHLSDGSYLDATEDHKWSVRRGRGLKQLETKEMVDGDKLESFEMDIIPGGIREDNAYQYGWVSGDGFIDGKRVMAVVQEPEYSILPSLKGVPYKEQHPDNYSRPFKRVNLSSVVDYNAAVGLRNDVLPDAAYSWDAKSIAEFFGGWIDSDGSLRQHNENTDHYVLHGTENKLRNAQLLLRRIGINHASLRLERKAGTETNYGVSTQDLWVLLIPSYECSKIATRLKVATRFGDRFATNPAHPNGQKIDKARKQKVVKIERLDGLHDTFCFSEPERHMGVFGNVLTYQCLVETFPANHESVEEYFETLKFAFLYAKTVTLLPTHNPLTNQVMLSNRRIGLSMSGIQQALKKFGFARFFEEFCDGGYERVRHWDRTYSRWLGIPTSIKVTTVKPSGTISLLAGATPGVHCTHSKHYFRTFRLSGLSPLATKLLRAGYMMEFSVTDRARLDKTGWKSSWGNKYTEEISQNPEAKEAFIKFAELGGSMVVYFPVKEKNFTKSKFDISMWEQLCLARELQDKWSDNSVSITVTFSDTEERDLKSAIEYMAPYMKTLSFLPLVDHKYQQAPYQEITEEEYLEYSKNLKKLKLTSTKGVKAKGEKYCNNDSCEL